MENSKGIIFHHGFSPGFDERSGGHSLVSQNKNITGTSNRERPITTRI